MNPIRLSPEKPQRQLQALSSPQGNRDIYNSVSYCNRCGACSQVCPSYQLHQQEVFSPRGRNQLLRLVLEGKIKLNSRDKLLTQTLLTCTLCGRCTQHCAGQIPTAEHVLEMRRALQMHVLPTLLYRFLNKRESSPRLFAFAARTALVLRQLGVLKLVRALQLTRLKTLSFLNHLNEILPAKTPSLKKVLQQNELALNDPQPQLIYLPSLEAQFVLPDIACQTLKLAQRKFRTAVWTNTPSGLFSYVYGDLRQSRRVLRRLIRFHAKTAGGNLPLLTDSIDVYLFLKRAPQLFAGYKKWEIRAQKLTSCVRFVTDIFPPVKKAKTSSVVQLEQGALFKRQDPVFGQAQKILYTLFGKNFVECSYTDADVPAYGYVFVAPQEAAKIGLQAVEKLARTRTHQVVALSGLAVLELNYLCKKFYPAAKATHFVDVDR